MIKYSFEVPFFKKYFLSSLSYGDNCEYLVYKVETETGSIFVCFIADNKFFLLTVFGIISLNRKLSY